MNGERAQNILLAITMDPLKRLNSQHIASKSGALSINTDFT